jgi:hypothetical protein
MGLDRTGKLMEFSEMSKVVAALKKFEVYRVYCRAEDSETRSELEAIIQGGCK